MENPHWTDSQEQFYLWSLLHSQCYQWYLELSIDNAR